MKLANSSPSKQKSFIGTVVRDRNDKTIIVGVERLQRHRLYGKLKRSITKLSVHDPDNSAQIGDTVLVEETRPLSATKRWRLAKITERKTKR